MENPEAQSPGVLDLISAVDIGRKSGASIPEISKSFLVWHSENVECVVSKYSEA
jgi:hypothetical protein